RPGTPVAAAPTPHPGKGPGMQVQQDERRRGRRWRLSLAVLIVLVGALALGELVLRLNAGQQEVGAHALRAETAAGVPFGDTGGRLILRHDPHLVFFPRPDQRLPGVTINAQGFRGADWVREKPSGVKRVLLLGG